MEGGERDRVRVVVQVLERVKAAPRREESGDVDAEVVAEEVVESVDDCVVCTRLGWLKLVVRERRRAVNGEGKGAGIRLIVSVADDDSSMVVSRPSKKLIRSGTALVKVSIVVGGRRMELVLFGEVCIMKTTTSDSQLRFEADAVWY